MKMGENSPPAIAGEKPPMVGASKVTDPMVIRWTDERHSLYLDSIEASFVNALYNSGYGSNGFLSSSLRNNIHANSSESNPKNNSFGQFKVLHTAYCENPKFERAKSRFGSENKLQKLSPNHWVQRLKSHSIAKTQPLTEADQMEINSIHQSVHFANQTQGKEATTSRQILRWQFGSQKIHEFSVGGIIEGSDQNFVDIKVTSEEVSATRCRKKRGRSVHLITDQVVPSREPTSAEKTAVLKKENEET